LFTFILISGCNLLPDQATPVMCNDIVPKMGKGSPIDYDDQSIERGQAIYQIQCESCHGELGLGDGVAGIN